MTESEIAIEQLMDFRYGQENMQSPGHARIRSYHPIGDWIPASGCRFALLCAVAAFISAATPAVYGEHHSQAAELNVPAKGRAGFTLLKSDRTGIAFTNRLASERSLTNQIYLNGSGVAAGDVDGDGLCDLYFAGLDGPNRLYRNQGNWQFEDISETAGVTCPNQASTGVALVDLDGDTDLDLLVNGIGSGTRLFRNQGDGRFEEAAGETGLNKDKGAMSLAVADVDGDGDLDLYTVNYRTVTFRDQLNAKFSAKMIDGKPKIIAVNGRSVNEPDLEGRFVIDPVAGVVEQGEADYFYLNHGNGTFSVVPWSGNRFLDASGQPIGTPYDWGLSAMFRDLNGDRQPDLYVCNDFQSPDRIWMNQGGGTFQEASPWALRQTSLFSMGVDVADLDRDGNDEIFVADMLSRLHRYRQVQRGPQPPDPQRDSALHRPQSPRNTLQWNRGDGTYAEIAQYAGLQASDWSWCPAFLDVDLDGYEDLLVTNGHERDSMNQDISRQIELAKRRQQLSRAEYLQLRRQFPRLETSNVAFHNLGNFRFEEKGRDWGFDSQAISHGMCLVDLDQDGDLDVAVNTLNDAALVYRNETAAPRVSIALRGHEPNTQGIGARIVVRGGPVGEQSQEMTAAGRYLSSDQALRTFAAGSGSGPLTIEVHWRSGGVSRVEQAAPNHHYRVDESGALDSTEGLSAQKNSAYFEDVSDWIDHQHAEQPYDDFQRQPLLPRKLSELGPGLVWFDLDGDGWEDLIIGGGRGGQVAVYRNLKGNQFERWQTPSLEKTLTRDQTGLLARLNRKNEAEMIAGRSNYEDGLAIGAAVERFVPAAQDTTREALLENCSPAIGPLAMGDADGDGDLDLFAGGRVVPGKYPQAASSYLLRNENGRWVRVAGADSYFENIGLISSALWSDINQDQRAELILACEWGPIRILQFRSGEIEELTEELGLKSYTGWWNSVQVADFNNDGKLDLAAGNWGRNSPFQSYLTEHPLEIYYGDADQDHSTELMEVYYAPELVKMVPWRDWGALSRAFPFINRDYESFTDFSRVGVSKLIEGRQFDLRKHSLRTLASTVFINRGNGFDVRPMPFEAQLAPVFGVAAGDLNGDGNEDLVLAQNFYGVASDRSRYDAGRGVWLKGDGTGEFEAVSGSISGLKVYGEGRGAALADFDKDGRLDLAVAQNGGITRLYRNRRAQKGLRVAVNGPPSNPHGIGTRLQPVYDEGRSGPLREIRMGGGYWSQDSFMQILGGRDRIESLKVTWPDGKTVTVPLAHGQESIPLNFQESAKNSLQE